MAFVLSLYLYASSTVGGLVILRRLLLWTLRYRRYLRRKAGFANHKRAFPADFLSTPDFDPNELYPAPRPEDLAEDQDHSGSPLFAPMTGYQQHIIDRYQEIRVVPERTSSEDQA